MKKPPLNTCGCGPCSLARTGDFLPHTKQVLTEMMWHRGGDFFMRCGGVLTVDQLHAFLVEGLVPAADRLARANIEETAVANFKTAATRLARERAEHMLDVNEEAGTFVRLGPRYFMTEVGRTMLKEATA